jgi:hypothetical protein
MTQSAAVFETALHDFKRSVEITRDVRFQANLRLARRQRWSAYMVSFLSLYVIALSLLPNIFKLQEQQNQVLLACSIILSVFVIFTSLIDGAQNFHHQGELLHQCARKVATVHHDLKNIDPADMPDAASKLEELQKRYMQALDECPINHENVDFVRAQAYKPHLFPNDYPKHLKFLKVYWNKIYAILGAHSWMFLHLIAIFAISWIVWKFALVMN